MKTLNNIAPSTLSLGEQLEAQTDSSDLRPLIGLGAVIRAKRSKLRKAKAKKKSSWWSSLFGGFGKLAQKGAQAAELLGVETPYDKELAQYQTMLRSYRSVKATMDSFTKQLSAMPLNNAEKQIQGSALKSMISKVRGMAMEGTKKLAAIVKAGASAKRSVLAGKPVASAFGKYYIMRNQIGYLDRDIARKVEEVSNLFTKLATAGESIISVRSPVSSIAAIGRTTGEVFFDVGIKAGQAAQEVGEGVMTTAREVKTGAQAAKGFIKYWPLAALAAAAGAVYLYAPKLPKMSSRS